MNQRKLDIETRIQDFLNFNFKKINEKQFNDELSDILKTALTIDLEGLPIDMLLNILEKRNKHINKLITDGQEADMDYMGQNIVY